MSELEGQQQASGRAMFLLSGPQREGAGEGGKQERSMRRRRRNGEAVFNVACRGYCEGRVLWPPRLGLSTFFSEEAHSEEPRLPCHPSQKGKQGRVRRKEGDF